MFKIVSPRCSSKFELVFESLQIDITNSYTHSKLVIVGLLDNLRVGLLMACAAQLGVFIPHFAWDVMGHCLCPCLEAMMPARSENTQLSVWGLCLFPSFPSGIFLPGTELLQSPFRTEFSMESRSRRYRRSLRCHRRFRRSYRRSLRRSAAADAATPIIARLSKHKTLLNNMKHMWNIVIHRKTLWTTSKT